MRHLILGLMAVWALVGAATGQVAENLRELGVVALYPPRGEVRSVALMLAGEAGWSAGMDARARLLAGVNTLAVGIDGRVLARGAPCLAVAPALLRLRHRLGRAWPQAAAIAPVLVGEGLGAQLGYVALAQGAPGGFKGLVSRGFDRRLAGREYCPGGSLAVAGGALVLGPKAPALWTELGPGGGFGATARPGLRLVPIDPVARPEAQDAALAQAYLRIAGSDAALRTGAVPPDLADLPLTVQEEPGAPHSDLFAVFLSGDGGWAHFDQEVSARLAAMGVPVVGVSALRYFWAERRPRRIAADVARIVRHYGPLWDRHRVVLIGFSFGASVTPFYAPELPPDLRAQVAGLALLAPEAVTGFEFRIGGWLGQATGVEDVGAAIDRAGMAVLCAHGSDEPASPCAAPRRAAMTDLRLEGGHHLAGAYDRLAAAIRDLAEAAPNAPAR